MTETNHNPGASRLDALFAAPAAAVILAIVCNCLWGSAFPFIKMGYRLFAIDSADTASILCFAGVRFMLAAVLVWLCGLALNRRPLPMPKGRVLAQCCGLGLWQTALQYFFYYSAAAALTGAMGGILNSTQSFLGVILAHFVYGKADRMTRSKALGCVLGFGGVLVATLGDHGGGSAWGMIAMLTASVIFAFAGPWNKSVTQKADSFSVCCINLGVGGLALAVAGFAMGGRLAPQSAAGLPVLLFLAFISGLCAVGAAHEEQPGIPHCGVRAVDSRYHGAAVRPAQRRNADGLAVSGRSGAGLRRHLPGQPPHCPLPNHLRNLYERDLRYPCPLQFPAV